MAMSQLEASRLSWRGGGFKPLSGDWGWGRSLAAAVPTPLARQIWVGSCAVMVERLNSFPPLPKGANPGLGCSHTPTLNLSRESAKAWQGLPPPDL